MGSFPAASYKYLCAARAPRPPLYKYLYEVGANSPLASPAPACTPPRANATVASAVRSSTICASAPRSSTSSCASPAKTGSISGPSPTCSTSRSRAPATPCTAASKSSTATPSSTCSPASASASSFTSLSACLISGGISRVKPYLLDLSRGGIRAAAHESRNATAHRTRRRVRGRISAFARSTDGRGNHDGGPRAPPAHHRRRLDDGARKRERRRLQDRRVHRVGVSTTRARTRGGEWHILPDGAVLDHSRGSIVAAGRRRQHAAARPRLSPGVDCRAAPRARRGRRRVRWLVRRSGDRDRTRPGGGQAGGPDPA